MVLPVSKILTLTVLKDKETAPFVMEMPPYHMPTPRGVLGPGRRAGVAVYPKNYHHCRGRGRRCDSYSVQFPGIGEERMAYYHGEKESAMASFFKKIEKNPYAGKLRKDNLMDLILYWNAYKKAKMGAGGKEAVSALNADFKELNADFFTIVQPGKDRNAKKVNRALKKLVKKRKGLLREMRKERIDKSFLGTAGRWLEPVTQWAGFNWRVNVALLSALAAKESSVATLGALYEQEEEGEALEQRMARGEAGFTPLHALALMLFMVLYPPCMATAIAVKIQAGSTRWMLFSIAYPMLLGIVVASLVFSLGSALGLSGLQVMFSFYMLALAFTIFMGFFQE